MAIAKQHSTVKPSAWMYWVKRFKRHYKKYQKNYYALILSCLLHTMLLLLVSLWIVKNQPPAFDLIPVNLETTTENPPLPDNIPPPPRIEDAPPELTNVTPSQARPTPVPLGDTNQPEEPLTWPAADAWKQELSQWVPQETFEPQPIGEENPRTVEELQKREEQIAQQIAQRGKQTLAVGEITGKNLQQIRSQGRGTLVQKGGGNTETEAAVTAGLDWLARHQSPNGGWSCHGFSQYCKEGERCRDSGTPLGDPAMTGLALLCFFGIGTTEKEGKYSGTVSKGLNYLLEIQTEDGCFGEKRSNYMYNHAMATLGMIEGSMMCHQPKYSKSARAAIQFLLDAQNPGAAWRYTTRCYDNDTSVTGWCMMALKAAQFAEIQVPKTAIEGGKRWLDQVTMIGEEPWVGYSSARDRHGEPCMTAVGTLCRIFFQEKQDNANILGASVLLNRYLPQWQANGPNNLYYWYYGTLVMYQLGAKNWEVWNAALQKALLGSQEKIGCAAGSWGNGQYNGGRVFWTSLAVLSLQVYYRYPRMFKK